MATEAASLIEKYKGAESADPSASLQLHQKLMKLKPEWEKFEATKAHAHLLRLIEVDAPALKTKAIIQGHLAILQACIDALSAQDDSIMQWILTLFYDMLRSDGSAFSLFEDGLKGQLSMYKPLMTLLGKQELDTYVADKAAWLLSAVMGHVPRFFNNDDVSGLLQQLMHPAKQACTETGVLEAITNLLKSDSFRGLVWSTAGVPERIFKVDPRTDSAPYQYRCVFAVWMLSFDPAITAELKNFGVIKKFKDILTITRTEKVVRLCLTVLKNFLSHKAMTEDIVEEGILEAVQQLEFEKWRDAELYDDIRDMAAQISSEVQEMSNFDRYERELQTGTLSWGFIHSTKFWAENVLKFEQNDFRALKVLAGLLMQPDTEPTTLAVACHDLGEFVTMHPLGKKKVNQLNVKERIMQLMGSAEPAYREVRREALLCCQKIMLNKWQEMDVAP